jgi:hypothetical protein
VADRPIIDVAPPEGGWGAPWPNVAEIEAVLPHDRWTLVGGLMAQLHGIHASIDAVRPTNDVDIVLHVETTRGIASETARALESLGYELAPSIDERSNTAHRFKRGESTVDVVTSGPDVVDVLVADHAAPRVVEKLHGRTMVAIEGGTQALRRTTNARLQITAGQTTTVSVPSPFGAAILKAAAYQTDKRPRTSSSGCRASACGHRGSLCRAGAVRRLGSLPNPDFGARTAGLRRPMANVAG